MKNSFFIIFLSLLFLSCEKTVAFDLKETAPKLVIDASIENGQAPIVVLSKSLNYFSTITAQQLEDVFIHNALVEVSSGTKTHRLKEYKVPLGAGFFYYYYSTDSSSLPTAITGSLNTTYSLKVDYNNEIYTATTRITSISKRVDSVWSKPMPRDTSNKKAIVMVRVTDPAGYGDYMRYWTKRNRESFLPGFTSVYDDLVIDGSSYEIEIEPGFNRNQSFTDNEEERDFRKGDTVVLKLSNIDKATYDFWRTMEFTYQSVGNPFSSPTKVISNISGNALGYFGGYASQYHQIIIPR